MASRFSIALGTLTQAQALLDKIVAQGALSTAQREASGPERWMLHLEGPRGNVARMQNEHQNGQFGAAWCPTRRQGGFIFRVFFFFLSYDAEDAGTRPLRSQHVSSLQNALKAVP